MKKGWEYKKLSDLYDVRDGTHDSPKYHETGYPLVTSKNLRGGILDMSNVSFISEEDYKAINNRSKVDIGDVLFAMIGTIGNPVYVQETPNYAIKNMALFKVPSNQSGEFLRYYLLNDNVLLKMQNESKGTTQKFVSLGYLRNFIIKIPSLSEQHSIVDYLDSAFAKIDALKANAEKAVGEAKALFQASLKEMLEPKEGWEEKKVGEIAEIKGGKRLPKGEKLLTEPTTHKYIRVADFNEYGTVDLDDIRYISDNVYEQIKRYIINKEDIYISIAGTIGKSGIIPEELDGANLTENACRLILSKEINQRFMYYSTISPEFIRQEIESTKISAQPKLALTRLAEILIAYPSITEQQSIVATLDSLKSKVDSLQENYEKISKECDALKQAMLREIFE